VTATADYQAARLAELSGIKAERLWNPSPLSACHTDVAVSVTVAFRPNTAIQLRARLDRTAWVSSARENGTAADTREADPHGRD
jgi:hypothetical protein